MPLAAPLPPFNHSPLCSSVFTTLPSIRETLVFTCAEATEKNSFPSCLRERTSTRSTCPREREQKPEKRGSRSGDRLGYQRSLIQLRRNQRSRRWQRKKRL